MDTGGLVRAGGVGPHSPQSSTRWRASRQSSSETPTDAFGNEKPPLAPDEDHRSREASCSHAFLRGSSLPVWSCSFLLGRPTPSQVLSGNLLEGSGAGARLRLLQVF